MSLLYLIGAAILLLIVILTISLNVWVYVLTKDIDFALAVGVRLIRGGQLESTDTLLKSRLSSNQLYVLNTIDRCKPVAFGFLMLFCFLKLLTIAKGV